MPQLPACAVAGAVEAAIRIIACIVAQLVGPHIIVGEGDVHKLCVVTTPRLLSLGVVLVLFVVTSTHRLLIVCREDN